jgi:hypothetical protein
VSAARNRHVLPRRRPHARANRDPPKARDDRFGTLIAMTAAHTAERVPYDDFLRREADSDTKHEWVNGVGTR